MHNTIFFQNCCCGNLKAGMGYSEKEFHGSRKGYFSRVSAIANHMKAYNDKITDETIVSKILSSPNKRFNHFVVAIEESQVLNARGYGGRGSFHGRGRGRGWLSFVVSTDNSRAIFSAAIAEKWGTRKLIIGLNRRTNNNMPISVSNNKMRMLVQMTYGSLIVVDPATCQAEGQCSMNMMNQRSQKFVLEMTIDEKAFKKNLKQFAVSVPGNTSSSSPANSS
uniref:Uncharacterized protein n=1 Tax=Solanum lycopersicum TaxID=4081 RepID=A0A3Q7JXA1_SOLLC